ncbi:MAG: ATP-binding cassette domain-containing protein [Pseudomonadota bacterium]
MQAYIPGNPYDLGRIISTTLAQAADGNWPGVLAGRSILSDMAVRSGFLAPLDALLARELSITFQGGRYYLLPAAAADRLAAALERMDAILGQAEAWGHASFATPLPGITVRVVEAFAAPTYVAFDTPSLALIQIPVSLLESADLARLLWHELGHCFLRCGVRFLDEGFATWAELHRHNGVFDADAARRGAAVAGNSEQLPLSELLTSGFSNALGFEDRVIDEAQRDALYPKGALAIDTIARRHGAAGLSALFAAIKRDPDQALSLFKEAAGDQFETLERLIGAADQACATAPARDPAPLRAAILEARARCDHAALREMAVELFDAGVAHGDPQLDAVLIDAFVSTRELGQVFDKAREKTIARLNADLDKRRRDVYSLELSARYALVKLVDADNFFDRATLGAKATKLVEAACALAPETPDALLTRAHLLIHTPQQYGGDPDAGAALLRRIARRSDWYGDIATSIHVKNYGAPPQRPEAPGAAPAAPEAEPVPSDAPLLFSLKGMSFGKNQDFSIELEQLEIRAGEVLGLIGPNGAGKSLLLECCLGLNSFQCESHQLFGQDFKPWHKRLANRRLVGAKLHRLAFEPSFHVADIVALARASFGADDTAAYQCFSIAPLLKKKYGWLSTGQRQRVDLYFAFHRDARLFFLDEPTLGLDDQFTARLFDLMAAQTKLGAATLVVSHYQPMLARCTRIGVLAGGRLQALGTPRELSARYLSDFRIDLPASGDMAALEATIRSMAPHSLIARPDGLIALGDQAFLAAFQANALKQHLHNYQVRSSQLSDLYTVAGSFTTAAEGAA